MTSLFGILGVGANGLNASSFGTNVTSQNASNVATDGYSRRIATLEPIGPPPEGGFGARASGARRTVDIFLERRLLGARSLTGEAAARARTLGILDSVLAESSGMGDAFDQFQTAIADLAAHPNDRSARTVVLERADAVAQAFRSAADAIATARSDANDYIEDEVRQVNVKLSEIASLGAQISKAEIGGQEASDLRDRRDQLVREVADFIPVTQIEDSTGRISLLLAGSLPLVSPDGQVGQLEAAIDASSGDMHVYKFAAGARTDVTAVITSGSIGGALAGRDGALADAANDLDQLAWDFAAAYNATHSAGVGLDGIGGRNLFEPPAAVAGAAAAMALSTDVAGLPDELAAATYAGALPGDNTNALALQALQDTLIASGGTRTAGQAFEALIGSAGSALQSANLGVERTADALAQLVELRESVSGVSLDEEMIALTRFQRAYQASLRVVETADQMLGELMEIARR
ncbi:MAG: flagellar hook-associated protein FlgK [Deltaproteobacteria bacterium]|nr:flagellar hook-associated protein FlgK [Deltaproteobacteria bacterium]